MRKEQQRFTRSLAQLGSVLHLVWNTTVIAQCLKLGKSALEGIILKPTMKARLTFPSNLSGAGDHFASGSYFEPKTSSKATL